MSRTQIGDNHPTLFRTPLCFNLNPDSAQEVAGQDSARRYHDCVVCQFPGPAFVDEFYGTLSNFFDVGIEYDLQASGGDHLINEIAVLCLGARERA